MCGVKQSIHVHCSVVLSNSIVSVGIIILVCVILYEVAGDRFTPHIICFIRFEACQLIDVLREVPL